MKAKSGKRIPIRSAKDIAKAFGYSQVIIHAYDGLSGIQHVTTYGKSQTDCENAAAGGNAIKRLLKWDESLCTAKPTRQIKKERVIEMENILKAMVDTIKKPNSNDDIILAKFIGLATLAEKTMKP